MKDTPQLLVKLKSILLYCGITKEEYDQVQTPVEEANSRALTHWSVLVSFFWIYCLVMSLKAADYRMCRPAYTVSLILSIFSFLCARFLVPRFPKTLPFFKYIFRLSLLGGAIGIAVCQWNVRSITLFAVAIISPSIFIDSTLSSLVVHLSALILYIALGRNTITPEIYSWGLGNYILFSVFGILIGNAINKERYESYVFAESKTKQAEMQTRYAYYDQLTGLKNRRAYEEKLQQLEADGPSGVCIVMVDINGLKETNDTIGHDAGDELITGASACMLAAFEGAGEVYRIGGDEFCIVMDGTVEQAQNCLSRLEELLQQRKGRYISGISVSAGVASDRDHVDIRSVIARADQNMYEQKRKYYLSSGADRRRR